MATEQLERLRGEVRGARDRSEWAAYTVAAKNLKQFLNDAPLSVLELARAYVKAGDPRAALNELDTYVAMGQSFDRLESLPEFMSLRGQAGFGAAFDKIRVGMAKNRQPVARSSIAFRLADAQLLPEDIAYDARSKRFFMTSVLQSKIVWTAGDGNAVDFAQAPDGWPMLALKIDAQRRLLWATEVALDGFDAVEKSDQGRSAILCYDLDTGKLLRRVEGPRPSGLGDIALTEGGEVIASDGNHGGVYRLGAADDQLQRLDKGDFISPQTVAIAPDGVHALVPDYVRGIGVLDLKSGQVRWLKSKGMFALNGIDGLYLARGRLIAVQNGTSPERVTTFSINQPLSEIGAESLIERSTATLGGPTHGVMVGSIFYYIANAGWDMLGDNGRIKAGVSMTPALVMQVDLRRQAL
jgi:hypothetical protein